MDEGLDPHYERIRDSKGIHSEAWGGTLEDMEAIAEDRRADGWEVVTVMSAHTDTVSIDMREHDRFGLMCIIPNNHVDDFVDAWDPDEYTEYLAYGRNVEGFMYVVIEFIDPENDRSILLACRYDMTRADGLVESAEKRGALHTHVKTVDGTILGTFVHEDYDPLVTPPDQ